MREIVQRPLARADLEGIWTWTYEHRGKEQANRYLQNLGAQIKKLAADPTDGRSMASIQRPEHYAHHVGRHVVIYTFTEDTLTVVRVLHDQMDAARHL
jgi:toxin ParE1/3/4